MNIQKEVLLHQSPQIDAASTTDDPKKSTVKKLLLFIGLPVLIIGLVIGGYFILNSTTTSDINKEETSKLKKNKNQINMKKIMTIFGIILFASTLLISCGSNTKKSVKVDLCRCMLEPGDSKYMQENSDACRDAISKEIGVDNWEKVNMSENPDIHAKFNEIASKCQ